jgi:polysaccharide biosynthesis/export protein
MAVKAGSMRDGVRRGGFLLAALAAFGMLAGCASSRGGSIPYEVASFGAPDQPDTATVDQDYRIAPLDTLRVNVFQVNDLSGEYQVDLAGNIALPLVGNVPAVGLTTSELQTRLVAAYGSRYLRNPDITVGIKESVQRFVTVDGAVAQPGVFPVPGQMTLMQAIAMARGTTDTANPRRVAIFRQIDGQRQAAAFDLVSIRRGEAEDPRIYRGDIIVVDGSNIKAIQREILSTVPLLTIFRPF